MAKSTKNLSSLMSRLVRSGSRANSGLITNLATQSLTSGGSGTTMRAGRDSEMKSQGFSAVTEARSIVFGRPASNTSTQSTSGSSELMNLLQQTASGGIASALGGSAGLGSLGGIASLISGIASLFSGGKSTPPPLDEFQLPASQNNTLHVHGNTSSPAPVTASEQGNAGARHTGIYGSPTTEDQSPSGQWIRDNNAQIAQAVKTALLHSSSLADVISEV
jgi:hypothetical protein